MLKQKNLIHCAIMFVLTFGIGALPPFGGEITPIGMKIIGVFIGLLYGWTFLGFFWTSCFGMLVLAFSGYKDITAILAEGFSSSVALQIIMLFIFVAYLIESGFVEMATGFFVTRKITVGKPFLLMFFIFYGCGLISMLGMGFGGLFFVWAIMYRIFKILGYKKGDMLVTYCIFGTAVTCGLTNATLPFVMLPVLFHSWIAPLGIAFPDISWLIWQFVYFSLFVVAYIFMGKYILRLDATQFIDKADEIVAVYTKKSATVQQKIAGIMVILFLIVTLLPSFLPAGAIKAFLAQFGLIGATLLLVVLTSLIHLDGKPIVNWGDCARKGINWDLVIMFVATTPIANALESSEAGVLNTIFAIALPVIQEMGPLIYTICVIAFFLIFTQVAHNVVLLIAFAPTLLSLGAGIGANVVFLAAMISIAAQAAFMTPGGSAQAAAVHSNVDWIDVKQAYIMGVLVVLLCIVCFVVTYPLGLLVF